MNTAPSVTPTFTRGDLAVDVREVSKSFGALVAVDKVSFEIQRGEVFGFLGPNGAGKTTTIRMLCGILQPTSGDGFVLGMNINREAELIKTRIGYMSQKFSLYDDLTVYENLNFYAGLQMIPHTARAPRLDETMEMAHLADRRDQMAGTLSGGLKQRLALACALVHQPDMVFLDEPTAGVDPVSRRRFWDVIYHIADRGATMLVTTHYMDEAEHFDRLVFIDHGRILAGGTPEEVKRTSFTGRLWEIDCSPLAAAADLARTFPITLDVSMPGSVIHVTTPEHITNPGALSDMLSRSGITVRSVRETSPSLEDVFVNLAGARSVNTNHDPGTRYGGLGS